MILRTSSLDVLIIYNLTTVNAKILEKKFY